MKTRIATLQTSTPFDLTLLFESTGTKKSEAELHLKFLKSRVRGEWFTLTQEIADFFGFELAPPMKLWSVYLAYVMRTERGQFQCSILLTVWAACSKEAIATAKTRNNILGHYLGAVAGIIPVEDMRLAIKKDNTEREADVLTDKLPTLYNANQEIVKPSLTYGMGG